MENKFGLPKKQSFYEKYNGFELKVQTTKDFYFGIVSEEDLEFLYLKPSIVYENLPRKDQSWEYLPKVEFKIPTAIKKSLIESISPLREGYIEDLVTRTLETNKYKQKENKS